MTPWWLQGIRTKGRKQWWCKEWVKYSEAEEGHALHPRAMSLSVPKPNVVQTQSSSPTNASNPPLSSPVVSLGWSSHFYHQLQEAGMMPSIVSRC